MNRAKSKKVTIASDSHSNVKRPNTPLDFRAANSGPQQRLSGVKFQQFGAGNDQQNPTTQRFNEWDPNQSMNSRQKSPQKQKNSLLSSATALQHQLQQQQQQNSNFAYTFMNTDSSPRQTSGRQAVGIQNSTKFQSQLSIGSGGGGATNLNQVDSNSNSNLDLMVSGQKVGAPRKESPTNTPRQEDGQQPQQQSNSYLSRSEAQKLNSGNNLNRPFTRRLKPLDNLPNNGNLNESNNNNSNLHSSGENQFIRQKT